ncbi:MAG: hypothetical protein Q8R15_04560, partial [Candidatus Micrarchaeota archaeon]|nr:hypothetical protein [Candidatus Micrarchaeota archaeon]
TFKGKAPSPAEFLRTHSLELHRQGVNTYWANEYHPRRETALFKADIGKHTTAVYSPKQEKSTWTVRLNSTSLEQMTQAQRTKLKAMLQKLKIA